MTTYDLKIEGMSCGHCVKTVQEALKRVKGVVGVSVEIGRAHVETAPEVTRRELIEAVEQVDYPAS